jgi:hypothetical protein
MRYEHEEMIRALFGQIVYEQKNPSRAQPYATAHAI